MRVGRGVMWGLASLAILTAAACGGGNDDDGGAIVTLVTPAGTRPGAASAVPSGTPIPAPELLLSALEVYQSGATLASVTGQVVSGTVTFLGRTLPLTKGTQSMYAFVPTDTDDAPGPHPIRVDFTLTNGTKGTLNDTVTLLKTQWTVDSLDFTESQTETLLDPKVIAAELATLRAVYAKVTPEKLWSGLWQLPVDGQITARYGEQRAINGSEPSGHHGGTDIGVPVGTPVHATNRGRVALVKQLQVRGNMVIIDHGGGLFSGYAHMSAFNVAEGQMVEAGEVIGMSGNTGLSTGAHLHWEMSAGGVLLDALRFTDGSNGF
ncbi:MAG: M23 family metallopeptidase [Anaerolineaceae bacterium]